MNTRIVSPAIQQRAQRNQTAILSAMAQVSQSKVAELMGTSESTVSRFKDKDLPEISAFLAACGMKAVSQSMQCFDPEYIRALKTLAGVGLSSPEPKTLEWDGL